MKYREAPILIHKIIVVVIFLLTVYYIIIYTATDGRTIKGGINLISNLFIKYTNLLL